MARTTDQIIATAEALARRFEAGDLPDTKGTIRDARPLRDVREAFEDLAHAERRLADRIIVARAAGHSWASVGMMVGTSGEAVRQRYSKAASPAPTKVVAKPGRRAVAPKAAAKTDSPKRVAKATPAHR